MASDSVAIEIVYAILKRPDGGDLHAIRSGGPRDAANHDLAQKIVAALREKDLLKADAGAKFQQSVGHPKTGR
jgi:hypothetical protein